MSEERRRTAISDKEVTDCIGAMEEAATDAEIRAALKSVTRGILAGAAAEGISQTLAIAAQLCRTHGLRLALLWGDGLEHIPGMVQPVTRLERFLGWWCVVEALRESEGPSDPEVLKLLIPRRKARLFCDMPYTLGLDGSIVTLENLPPSSAINGSMISWSYSLRDYFRSLEPAKRRGRPAAEQTRTKSRNPKDKASLRAAFMDADSADWESIATCLGVAFDLYDQKAKDAARKLVKRRIHRGYNLIDKGYTLADAAH